MNSKDAAGGDRITQFGRALPELNIDIICANSPQAKGRITAANAWLPGFMTTHNDRLGRAPASANLDEILAWREERSVTRNLTLHL